MGEHVLRLGERGQAGQRMASCMPARGAVDRDEHPEAERPAD